MPDFSVPDSPMQTKAILDEIDERVAKAELVYLHCWGGIGRTGLIVGCWLARHGLEGRAALECLRELWKHCPKSATRKSPETAQQEEYIIHWTEPE
jgi:protein-tyrosine phosphatase